MRRSRAPPTNAAVFIETNDPVGGALGACAPASVYIDSLGRFGSIAEARKQDQIKLGDSERVERVILMHVSP